MIYLDNAATSFPKPARVVARLGAYLDEFGGCAGRGGYPLARQADALVMDTRRILTQLLHAEDPARIILTFNATDALNLAIKGVLTPGDHVVTTALEHNSVARPLRALEQAGAITLTWVGASGNGLIDPADIGAALTPRTALVAVVHGSNAIGSLQPVAAIGRRVRAHGALFLVDAAQTAGAVPIDVQEACIDLLAAPGHKALLGLPGTGLLYVGPRAEVRPWREGGTGLLSEEPLQPRPLPLRLEAGSHNTLGLAGLRDSVRLLLEEGILAIRRRELALTRQLIDGAQALPRIRVYGPDRMEDRVAIVSLTVTGWAPDAAAAWLSRERGIAVRAGLHCAPGAHRCLGTAPSGTVRFSPGAFTTPEDIEAAVAALSALAEESAEPLTAVRPAPIE